MSARLAEYFLTVGYGDSLEPVDASSPAAPLHPQSYIDGVYKCKIMDRYPLEDHASIPLPPSIAMFCMPDDVRLTTSASLPVFYSFAATQANGNRLYGFCLRFVEALPDALVKQLNEKDRIAQESVHQQLIASPDIISRAKKSQQQQQQQQTAAYANERSTTYNLADGSEATSGKVLDEAADEADIESMRKELERVQQLLHQHQLSPDYVHDDDVSQSNSTATAQEPTTPTPLPLSKFLASGPVTPQPQRTQSDPTASVTPRSTLVAPTTASTISTDDIHLTHATSPTAESSVNTIAAPSTPLRFRTQSASVNNMTGNNRRTSLIQRPSMRSTNTYVSSLPRAERQVYAPRCICILSCHPFIKQFREFLTELYRISLTPMLVPIERILSNFMLECPLPPLGQYRVQYNINSRSIIFSRPPKNDPLAFHNFPIKLLFECLDLQNVVRLFEAVLLEKRILLLSTKYSALSIVCEILATLIYPFQWQHVFIPLLPKALREFLGSPPPFIIGMHQAMGQGNMFNLLSDETRDDLVIVDLDKNAIHTAVQIPQLPPRERRKLLRQLTPLQLYTEHRSEYAMYMFNNLDLAFPIPPPPEEVDMLLSETPMAGTVSQSGRYSSNRSSPNSTYTSPTSLNSGPLSGLTRAAFLDSIRKNSDGDRSDFIPQTPQAIDSFIVTAFFRVFVSLFKNYRDYLMYPSAQQSLQDLPDPPFRTHAYQQELDLSWEDGGQFMTEFLQTQAFARFCEDRIVPYIALQANQYHKATLSPTVQHFDESILAKRNRSRLSRHRETPFLTDRRWEITKQIVVPAPDIIGLPSLDKPAASDEASKLSDSDVGKPALTITVNDDKPPIPRQASMAKYTYERFPRFTASLFGKARISHAMMSPETTQRAVSGSRTDLDASSQLRSPSSQSTVGSAASKFQRYKTARSSIPSALRSHAQLIHSIWISVFAAVVGDQKQAEQLDVAFAILKRMRAFGVQPEEEVYEKLMYACGLCRSPEKAVAVLNEMEIDGFHPTANTYSILLNCFAINNDHRGYQSLLELRKHKQTDGTGHHSAQNSVNGGTLSPEQYLRQLQSKQNGTASAHSRQPSSVPMASRQLFQQPTEQTSREAPQQGMSVSQPLQITQSPAVGAAATLHYSLQDTAAMTEADEYSYYQSAFTAIFPALTIDTIVHCPECNRLLTDRAIRAGWRNDSNDYTTRCISCGERFVARFSVHQRESVAQSNNAAKQSAAIDASIAHTTVVPNSSVAESDMSVTDASLQSPSSTAVTANDSVIPSLVTPANNESTAAADKPNDAAAASVTNSAANPVPAGKPPMAPVKLNEDKTKAASRPDQISTKLPKSADAVLSPHSGAVIFCEYLSPAVLKKELAKALKSRDAAWLLSRSFRRQSPALFWNLQWHFSNYMLPVDLLLQHYHDHVHLASPLVTKLSRASGERPRSMTFSSAEMHEVSTDKQHATPGYLRANSMQPVPHGTARRRSWSSVTNGLSDDHANAMLSHAEEEVPEEEQAQMRSLPPGMLEGEESSDDDEFESSNTAASHEVLSPTEAGNADKA